MRVLPPLPAVLRAAAVLLAAAGCGTNLPPLPREPAGYGRPEEDSSGAPAALAGEGPAPERRPEPPPPPEETTPAAPPAAVAGSDLLLPSKAGDFVHEGVVLLDPVLDAPAATATFRVRNEREEDLPDLILTVVFAVPVADRPDAAVVPRFETVETPLARGETRRVRAALALGPKEPRPRAFRVVAGLPEVLAAPGDGSPGTTFLGGMLECVELDADLTGDARHVAVGLSPRPGAPAALPDFEGQLLLSRAGTLVWTGAWILLPRTDPTGGTVRRVRWNLPEEAGVAGATIYLRVRERR